MGVLVFGLCLAMAGYDLVGAGGEFWDNCPSVFVAFFARLRFLFLHLC